MDEKKTTVGRNFGSAPTVVEGLAARITLLVAASRVRAWALDERGSRREEIKVTGSERATLEIGVGWRTLWYEIEIIKTRGLAEPILPSLYSFRF